MDTSLSFAEIWRGVFMERFFEHIRSFEHKWKLRKTSIGQLNLGNPEVFSQTLALSAFIVFVFILEIWPITVESGRSSARPRAGHASMFKEHRFIHTLLLAT